MKHKNLTTIFLRTAGMLTLMVLNFLISPNEARADTSGYCGTIGHETEVTWSYNATTTTLTISGTGAIMDYDDEIQRPGWEIYKALITKIVINDGVTAIGKWAFKHYNTLSDVTIPASITTIGDNAFLYCSRIKNISFANGSQLTDIGDGAFQKCIDLTSITFPDHVETIGASAFMGCRNLTSVTIPASMTTIGDDAFCDCISMADVYCYVADPTALAWEENGVTIDFMAGKATKCHVFDKAAFDAQWAKGESTDINVTFVGDLRATPVNYIDADGRQQFCCVYTELSDGESTTLNGGWYIVDDNVSYTSTGTNELALVFTGDAHIILSDSKELTVHGSIKSIGSLTIYCQNSSNGMLTVNCNAAHGLYAEDGSVTINGGTVAIQSVSGDAIRAKGSITINGGIVNAMSDNGNGIYTTDGDITLGYRDDYDQITAKSYIVTTGHAVKIIDGKHYIVNSNLYIGTLTSAQCSAIGGQRLEWPNNYLVMIESELMVKFAGDADYRTWENADYTVNHTNKEYVCFVVDKSLVGSKVELLGTEEDTKVEIHYNFEPADARFIVTDFNGDPVSVAYTYGNDPDNLDINCGHKDGSFTMPAKNVYVCVKAVRPMPYVDENGDTRVLRDGYEFLEGDYKMSNASSLPSGWYVGYGDIEFRGNEVFGFELSSDVKLILCDGADVQIFNNTITCSNLSIYGQNNGTGILTVYNPNGFTIKTVTNPDEVNGRYGANLSIYGGTVSLTGNRLLCENINLCGGTLINNSFITGILHLYGGTFTTLQAVYPDVTTIALGLAYTDGSNYYVGGISQEGFYNLDAVTLRPLPAVTLNETDGVTATIADELKDKVGVFRRSFTADKASTVCLPFGIDADQAEAAGKFYTFVGVDKSGAEWEVIMQETAPSNLVSGALSANTPYLFKPKATGEVTFCGLAAESIAPVDQTPNTTQYPDAADWAFKGTYERIDWPDDPQTIYGFAAPGKADLAEGKFFRVKGGSNSYVLPFRAYLQYSGTSSARAVTRGGTEDLPETMTVRLISAEGTPTAIGTLNTRTGEVTFDSDAWYSLDGRRIQGQPTQKGVYINNGKKIVIK